MSRSLFKNRRIPLTVICGVLFLVSYPAFAGKVKKRDYSSVHLGSNEEVVSKRANLEKGASENSIQDFETASGESVADAILSLQNPSKEVLEYLLSAREKWITQLVFELEGKVRKRILRVGRQYKFKKENLKQKNFLASLMSYSAYLHSASIATRKAAQRGARYAVLYLVGGAEVAGRDAEEAAQYDRILAQNLQHNPYRSALYAEEFAANVSRGYSDILASPDGDFTSPSACFKAADFADTAGWVSPWMGLAPAWKVLVRLPFSDVWSAAWVASKFEIDAAQVSTIEWLDAHLPKIDSKGPYDLGRISYELSELYFLSLLTKISQKPGYEAAFRAMPEKVNKESRKTIKAMWKVLRISDNPFVISFRNLFDPKAINQMSLLAFNLLFDHADESSKLTSEKDGDLFIRRRIQEYLDELSLVVE